MNPQLTLRLARAGFVLFSCLLGVALALSSQSQWWAGAFIGLGFGAVVVGLDMLLRQFTIGVFSSATFGLMIGILCAWLLTQIPFPDLPWLESSHGLIQGGIYCALGFLGISLALRSNREEFALIIPYVRFRQEGIEEQKLLVDTNILIDGRLPGICETGFITGSLMVPRFVLDEMHLLADSPDATRRERGKRGLECLEQLRSNSSLHVKIHEDFESAPATVDARLIQLARILGARILTNDANLGRVAALQGVVVLNLHSLAKAMRPNLLPGDEVDLTLIKEGKDPHQAVGYLPDGSMIVVNHAIQRIGQTVPVTIISSLQTTAGRLVFAEIKGSPPRK